MKLFLALAVIILSSCGSEESSSENRSPNLTDPNNQKDDDGNTKKPEFYDFHKLTGEPFPSNKLPSIIEKNKEIDICKKSQIFHADECFDELHLTEDAGFRLVKGEKSVSESGVLSEGFLDLFVGLSRKKIPDVYPETETYQHLLTISAGSFGFSPVFWRSGYLNGKLDIVSMPETLDYRFGSLTVETKFVYPKYYMSPPVHEWNFKGTLTISATTLNFPIKFSDIADITGDGFSYEGENRTMKFEYSASPDGIRRNDILTSVTY